MSIQTLGFFTLRKGHDRRAGAHGGDLPGVVRRYAVVRDDQRLSRPGQILCRPGQRAALQYDVVTAAGIFYRKNHAFTPLYVPASFNRAHTAESSRSIFWPLTLLILPSASTKK